MSVYVDDMTAPLGRMLMCHMIADSHSELMAMAAHIGVRAKHLQDSRTYKEHFDICQSKRQRAVQLGARQISQKELGKMLLGRRRKLADVMEKLRQPQPDAESSAASEAAVQVPTAFNKPVVLG